MSGSFKKYNVWHVVFNGEMGTSSVDDGREKETGAYELVEGTCVLSLQPSLNLALFSLILQ